MWSISRISCHSLLMPHTHMKTATFKINTFCWESVRNEAKLWLVRRTFLSLSSLATFMRAILTGNSHNNLILSIQTHTLTHTSICIDDNERLRCLYMKSLNYYLVVAAVCCCCWFSWYYYIGPIVSQTLKVCWYFEDIYSNTYSNIFSAYFKTSWIFDVLWANGRYSVEDNWKNIG